METIWLTVVVFALTFIIIQEILELFKKEDKPEVVPIKDFPAKDRQVERAQEQTQNLDYPICLEKNMRISDIIVDYMEFLVENGVKMPATDNGAMLFYKLVMRNVIWKIDISQYLEINDRHITIDDILLLNGDFGIYFPDTFTVGISISGHDQRRLPEYADNFRDMFGSDVKIANTDLHYGLDYL